MKTDLILTLVLALCLASAIGLSRGLAQHRSSDTSTEEPLYLNGRSARRLSLAFNGLAADWYWLRSLQYVGRKALAHKGEYTLDDLRPLGLRNLGALLEQSTALDPQFMSAYDFGAVVLPS